MLSANPRIGLIGFGEVGFHLSRGLKRAGVEHIFAYTRKHAGQAKQDKLHRAETAGVELVPTLRELVAQSELVISAVNATSAPGIMRRVAQLIRPGAMFADLNNVIPTVKKQGAALINAKGASFVDIGLIEIPALVEHRALMYVSGDGAEEFCQVMSQFGMNIQVMTAEAGQAATIKTLMNIYLKGIQALTIEVALSACKASLPLEQLGGLLSNIVKDVPDEDEMTFWIGRGLMHADRKAAEVKSIVKLMNTWGVDPLMMKATAQRLGDISRRDLDQYIGENFHPQDGRAIFKALDQMNIETTKGPR